MVPFVQDKGLLSFTRRNVYGDHFVLVSKINFHVDDRIQINNMKDGTDF
jgi:hypothetical protein